MVLGVAGAVMFQWRRRAVDRPLRVGLPSWLRLPDMNRAAGAGGGTGGFPRILDRYVVAAYVRVFGLAACGMAAIFYISTFIDLSDKVFKGDATWAMLGNYFVLIVPQYAYYIVPLSVLLAALVTVGVLTKNNELIVMRACGISLYRMALPIMLCAALAGGLLFALEETVLGPANRRAERLRSLIRSGVQYTEVSQRQWLAGDGNEIYNYTYVDPVSNALLQVAFFQLSDDRSRLETRVFAERAVPQGPGSRDWTFERGWTRTFREDGEADTFTSFDRRDTTMVPTSMFVADAPDARFMGYTQLSDYARRLKAGGLDVMSLEVAAERKRSFPFVTLIMTLIAVPFAVLTGHRGAMAGVGVGIGLAITYWTAISVCAAMGTAGTMPPLMAAWAPNAIFGAGAAYLLLSVRT
jgi:LPS export ABC transporter permease LptG